MWIPPAYHRKYTFNPIQKVKNSLREEDSLFDSKQYQEKLLINNVTLGTLFF